MYYVCMSFYEILFLYPGDRVCSVRLLEHYTCQLVPHPFETHRAENWGPAKVKIAQGPTG